MEDVFAKEGVTAFRIDFDRCDSRKNHNSLQNATTWMIPFSARKHMLRAGPFIDRRAATRPVPAPAGAGTGRKETGALH